MRKPLILYDFSHISYKLSIDLEVYRPTIANMPPMIPYDNDDFVK